MVRFTNQRKGEHVEKKIAAKFDLEHVPNESDWYDLVNPRTNTKHEVKSTEKRHEIEKGSNRQGGKGEKGRFRLYESQHRSLVSSDNNNVAWYHFVLLDSNGNINDHRKMKPTSVTQLVEQWSKTSHKEINREYKLPYSKVF